MKQPPTNPPDRIRQVFIIRCPVCKSFNSIFRLTAEDCPIDWHCADCGNRLTATQTDDLFDFISCVRQLPDSR